MTGHVNKDTDILLRRWICVIVLKRSDKRKIFEMGYIARKKISSGNGTGTRRKQSELLGADRDLRVVAREHFNKAQKVWDQ
jgi:hypothetical protein